MKRGFPSLEKGDILKDRKNERERELKSDYWALTEPSILKTLENFPSQGLSIANSRRIKTCSTPITIIQPISFLQKGK